MVPQSLEQGDGCNQIRRWGWLVTLALMWFWIDVALQWLYLTVFHSSQMLNGSRDTNSDVQLLWTRADDRCLYVKCYLHRSHTSSGAGAERSWPTVQWPRVCNQRLLGRARNSSAVSKAIMDAYLTLQLLSQFWNDFLTVVCHTRRKMHEVTFSTYQRKQNQQFPKCQVFP